MGQLSKLFTLQQLLGLRVTVCASVFRVDSRIKNVKVAPSPNYPCPQEWKTSDMTQHASTNTKHVRSCCLTAMAEGKNLEAGLKVDSMFFVPPANVGSMHCGPWDSQTSAQSESYVGQVWQCTQLWEEYHTSAAPAARNKTTKPTAQKKKNKQTRKTVAAKKQWHDKNCNSKQSSWWNFESKHAPWSKNYS